MKYLFFQTGMSIFRTGMLTSTIFKHVCRRNSQGTAWGLRYVQVSVLNNAEGKEFVDKIFCDNGMEMKLELL